MAGEDGTRVTGSRFAGRGSASCASGYPVKVMSLDSLSREMTLLVADASLIFRQMGVGDWTRSRGDGAWTRLEILGHLIDSAINNHQRFVRAMAEGGVTWPGYDQTAMVSVQRFGSANPAQLVNLWEALNLYLARLIALIPADKLDARCVIGCAPPVTLGYLVADYGDHMQHHLRQIFEGMPVTVRWMKAD